jgi:hypothetical protein
MGISGASKTQLWLAFQEQPMFSIPHGIARDSMGVSGCPSRNRDYSGVFASRRSLFDFGAPISILVRFEARRFPDGMSLMRWHFGLRWLLHQRMLWRVVVALAVSG